MKKSLVVLLALSLLLVSCTEPEEKPQQPQQKQQQQLETDESYIFDTADVQNCRITADKTPVKSGKGNNFSTIAYLKKNDVVKVLDEQDNWYIILLDNNQVGALPTNQATPVVRENQTSGNEPNGETNDRPNTNVKPREQQNENQDTQNKTEPNNAPNNIARNNTTTNLASNEQQMVNLVNAERKKNNLPPLTVDPEVTRVARIKSQDMVDNNYFSHNSPNYGSPFEMMDDFDIEYLHAGENLAGNSTVQRAHNALMNSSGHRKNILSPNFTHIGIGIKPSEKYGYIFTQMFISKPQ